MRSFLITLLTLLTFAGCGRESVNLSKLPEGGDFVLQSAEGSVDTQNLRGKVLLIFFGYSNCPDVCPAALAVGGQALNALSPEERDKVRMLMISVDPARDTPAKLKEYTSYFHPEMRGMTGTTDEIAEIAKRYGAGYIVRPPNPDGSYAVDHTSATFMVGPDGKLINVLSANTTVDKVVAAIRKAL